MSKQIAFILSIIICLSSSAYDGKSPFRGDLSIESVTSVCNKVNQWQINNHIRDWSPRLGWVNGSYYIGLLKWGEQKGDMFSIGYFFGLAESREWTVSDLLEYTHADDHAIGLSYLEMYRIFGERKMIQDIKERLYYVASHPFDSSLTMANKETNNKRWTWVDALFMSPAVFAGLYKETGEQIYADYLEREFWASVDYLYDKEEHLFYRDDRYFSERENNGKKVFWGRGCGWAAAALPLILDNLPLEYPFRKKYEKLLSEFLKSIVKCQDPEGSWHASMLDLESFPDAENSASAFFCYSLAWALRNGVVKGIAYEAALKKGWNALTKYVTEDGRLISVQGVGGCPAKFNTKSTALFGTGALLLAGSEICKYLGEAPKL